MEAIELHYESHDGVSDIRSLLWQQDAVSCEAPRGIVQIVHGMSEHVERYAPFASFLVSKGFVVCANDHVGHGKSASDKESLGHMPLRNGAEVLIEDVHELRKMMQGRYGEEVPFVMFGHSMGSFVTRCYLTRYAKGLAAAVLCGTGQQPRALSRVGNAVCHILAAFKGERYCSAFVDSLGAGAFSKAISDARTEVDWISTDPEVVDAYRADSACGQMFTLGAYASLTALALEATDPKRARLIPKGLPLLFIAGGEDPVGNCGKGVERAAEQYRAAGILCVDMKLYDGMRHEILNEPVKEEVFNDVDRWLRSKGI